MNGEAHVEPASAGRLAAIRSADKPTTQPSQSDGRVDRYASFRARR